MAQIFLEAVLTIETIQELQSNFEEKNSFSNSKLLQLEYHQMYQML